jgi:hypothetical protein
MKIYQHWSSGDMRVNEQLTLGVMHLLWVREHNRLARQLTKINPHWGDERLFQVSIFFSVELRPVFTYNMSSRLGVN